jgi:ABC-type glycerol-3-phosphate transport system permease component
VREMTRTKTSKKKKLKKKTLFERDKYSPLAIILLIVLSLYVLSMILIVSWGIFTSLKSHSEFRNNQLWLPHGAPWTWEWKNFATINKYLYISVIVNGRPVKMYMERLLLNTLLYAVGGALITTLVPCVVSYLCAKFDYAFSRVIYGVVIVTMVLPIIGSTPSMLQMLKRLNLYDSMLGNYISKFHFLGLYFLVFYATFRSFPDSYAEAAYIDGASEYAVLFQIVFPLIRNMIGTVILLNFIGLWNDYQTPLIYLPSYPTLAYGVFYMSNSSVQELNTVPLRMAGCIILFVPILILFLIFKNKLMGNLSMGGLKE